MRIYERKVRNIFVVCRDIYRGKFRTQSIMQLCRITKKFYMLIFPGNKCLLAKWSVPQKRTRTVKSQLQNKIKKNNERLMGQNKNLLCLKSTIVTETEKKNKIQTVWIPQSVTHEDLIPPKLGSIVCKMTSVQSKLIKTGNKTSPWIRYTVGFPRFNRYLASCVLGDGSCRKKLIN